MYNVRQNNTFSVLENSYNGVPKHLQNKMNLHSRHLKIFSPNVVFIALNKGLVYKLECAGYIYYFQVELTKVLEGSLHWQNLF